MLRAERCGGGGEARPWPMQILLAAQCCRRRARLTSAGHGGHGGYGGHGGHDGRGGNSDLPAVGAVGAAAEVDALALAAGSVMSSCPS